MRLSCLVQKKTYPVVDRYWFRSDKLVTSILYLMVSCNPCINCNIYIHFRNAVNTCICRIFSTLQLEPIEKMFGVPWIFFLDMHAAGSVETGC